MKKQSLVIFVVIASILKADNTNIASCPATEWKSEAIAFEKKFFKDSVTDIPGVKILQDAKIVSTFFWQEQSIAIDQVKKIHRLKDPGLVYTTSSLSAEWAGITLSMTVSLEGHSSTDFMRIDEVRVRQSEFLEAQNNPAPNVPKSMTTVAGAKVFWAWRDRDPILTRIEKEGSEIELMHSSNEVEVMTVSQPNGTEAVVLSDDGNLLYPGNFRSVLKMNHSVTVNCP